LFDAVVFLFGSAEIGHPEIGPPGQGPGSEASTFCEKHMHAILENFSNHQFAFLFPPIVNLCSVPFNVEGNEAENDAVCPSLP